MTEPGQKVPEDHGGGDELHRRLIRGETLQERIALRRQIGNEVLSLASLLGRPVVDVGGSRVGRVDDVVARWERGESHPKVSGILVSLDKGLAFVDIADVALEQAKATLRKAEILVATPVRQEGDIALARDVLDHQLVDVQGVQVRRAADVYFIRFPDGWRLGGVDVGVRAFGRRLIPKARHCPPPSRAIAWADLQTFVARPSDVSPDAAAAVGTVGSSLQLGTPAKDVRKLKANEVANLLSDLGRREGAQVTALAEPKTAADALHQLSKKARGAILAELNEDDREKLLALLDEGHAG